MNNLTKKTKSRNPSHPLQKSTSNIGAEHSTTYLGEGKHPTKEDLVKLWKKHKVKGYADIILEVQYIVNKWNSFAKELGISTHTREQIAKTIESIQKIGTQKWNTTT